MDQILFSDFFRNETAQEQLWDISINIVKDYLSPEVLEKYGPVQQLGIPSEQADNSREQLDRPSESSQPNKQAEQSDHASHRNDQQTGERALDERHDLSQDSKEESNKQDSD